MTATTIRSRLDTLSIERRCSLAPVDLGAAADTAIAIACAGRTHHARVEAGAFVTLDHDVEAELAMVALGAVVPECLLYKAAWDGATSDAFLAEWAADGDGERVVRAREDWLGNYWDSWPQDPPPARVLFGPRLQRVLAFALCRAWPLAGGRDGPGSLWASVRHAVTVRARRALVLSLADVEAHRRPDALVPMAVTVVPSGRAVISGVLSRRVSAIEVTLPVSWLEQVWQHDDGLTEGRFTLARDARSATAVEWRRTGGWHREHSPVLVHLPARLCG